MVPGRVADFAADLWRELHACAAPGRLPKEWWV